ncbi:MAG TPA: efflux transporter outer membrane subunit [Burkholderiaceae bacterium]|nr:efflux transporter outer membrane subunit [Burkholderiaceae bacterium]
MTHIAARIRRAALAALAGTLLGGCVSLAPEYERPALPVADNYPPPPSLPASAPLAPAAAASAAAGRAAVDIPWQQFFGDERLKGLIALALQNNRDLRVAVANIEQARAVYQIRRADQVPNFNLGVVGNRLTNAGGGITSSYVAGLSLASFELDFFGRVKSLSDAALELYLASEEARRSAQITLVAAVANAYYSVLADNEQLALAIRTSQTREVSLQLTQLKFDNGVASELDIAQARSLVEGARVAQAALARMRAQDENALVLLVGAPVKLDLAPDAGLVGTQVGPDLPAGLPSELLTHRPDIRQAEQQLRAANANIGAARAAFFPRISLTGSAGFASGDLLGLFDSGTLAWSFTGQLLQPIFDGGRNQANLDAAKAARDIGVAQYEKSIQTAFREVADALAARAMLGQQLDAQRAQAQAEELRFRLADLRYRNGVTSFLDVLDAQRSLFTTQLATVQVQLSKIQNEVILYKVLGGGWTEPVAQ